ncbi:GNAT family N-acetyltransferase [Sphingobacterium psychroaquaticum]|nr:GNAT family N-acetyltransferase [Sphingobacterium psychroaquaticum]
MRFESFHHYRYYLFMYIFIIKNKSIQMSAENTRSGNRYTLEHMVPSQWELYKSIRLEALQTNPEVFGSNYAKEVLYTQENWVSFLADSTRAIFGLWRQGEIVGLTAVALHRDDPTKAILYSTFIKEEHRARGLSRLFYEARIEWARSQGCAAVVVSHRQGNDASMAANQRYGFIYTHTEQTQWPDGTVDDELMYILEL